MPRTSCSVPNLSDGTRKHIAVNVIHPGSFLGSMNNVAPETIKSPHDVVDIANGRENVVITLVNEVNDECPPSFHYIRTSLVFENAYVNFPLARIGDQSCCSSCSGDCLSASKPCACALESGGEFAYTPNGLVKEEFLEECISMTRDPKKHCQFFCKLCPLERAKGADNIEPCKGHLMRKFIKECWSKCGCHTRCGNRVIQRGISYNLQVFMTSEEKGWGLRTLVDLPKGAFVCEYAGEILTNSELYDRGLRRPKGERHTYPILLDADWGAEGVLKDDEALCLDASCYGNVGRFINHRCGDSNLVEIPVEVETSDHHIYHVAFFTTRKVKAMEELTWDYGIDFDNHDHPIKAFPCQCGSKFCYNIMRLKMTRTSSSSCSPMDDNKLKRKCIAVLKPKKKVAPNKKAVSLKRKAAPKRKDAKKTSDNPDPIPSISIPTISIPTISQRCTIRAFCEFVNKWRDTIPLQTWDILETTVFWSFIKCFKDGLVLETDCVKQDIAFELIMKHFDKELQSLVFGDVTLDLVPSHVKLLFHLPDNGRQITHTDKSGGEQAKLLFPSCTERNGINRKLVMSSLVAELAKKKDAQEIKAEKADGDGADSRKVASLMLMYLNGALFFSRTGINVSWSIVNICLDIDRINEWNWAASVMEFLLEGLTHHKKDRPRTLNGCLLLLDYMFLENTMHRAPRAGIGSGRPHFLKWSLRDIFNKNAVAANPRILEDLVRQGPWLAEQKRESVVVDDNVEEDVEV